MTDRTRRLGRLPRGHDPRIPHYDALTSGLTVPAPPPSRDWSVGMPPDLGAMLNDRLGDCTCAAVYHLRQVLTFNANPPMMTAPDAKVEELYELACGYVPGDPATDQGGVVQDVLTHWLKSGVPTMVGPDHMAAFVEVNPKNRLACQGAIEDCGGLDVGMEVPDFVMDAPGGPPPIWDVAPAGADASIAGGHSVAVVGYDATGFRFVSWGNFYRMTWAFWFKYVDEAYAVADPDWIEKSGQSPVWLTLPELEAAMTVLKDGEPAAEAAPARKPPRKG